MATRWDEEVGARARAPPRHGRHGDQWRDGRDQSDVGELLREHHLAHDLRPPGRNRVERGDESEIGSRQIEDFGARQDLPDTAPLDRVGRAGLSASALSPLVVGVLKDLTQNFIGGILYVTGMLVVAAVAIKLASTRRSVDAVPLTPEAINH
jgi:hypothetical protein